MAPIQEAWGGPGREREVDYGVDVDLLIKQVQTRIYQRRLRVRDFFRDYDRFRCGRCTRQQFSRAVGGFAPGLRPQEVGALADRFTVEGPQVKWPQNIDYVRFIQVLDEVFGVQGLESRPDLKVPKPGAALTCTAGFRPGQADDETRAREVVRRIALLTRTRGVDLSSCYLYGQRTDAACLVHMRGSGKISKPMFLQRFPFLHDFSERDLQLLCQRFAAEHATVNVHMLLREIDAELEGRSSGPSEVEGEGQDEEAPEVELEQEPLAATVTRRQEDAFAGRPPPPMPRRPSSAESLRRAVSASRIGGDGQGAEAPRQRAGPSRPSSAVGLRNSASFRTVAAAHGEKDRSLPPRPHGSATSTRSTDRSRPEAAEVSSPGSTYKHGAHEADEDEPLDAEPAADPQPPPPPQQQRRPASAVVGVSRPGSAVSRSSSARAAGGCWPANTAPAGRPSVNLGGQRPASATPGPREPWPRNRNAGPAQSPAEVLTKLRSTVAERRIRVSDCFQDFDRLRRGVCTFTSLRSALTLVGLELEHQDYETLFELFQDGEGMFRYRDFCAEVNGEAIEVCVQNAGPHAMTASKFKADMTQKVSSALEELEAQVRRKTQVRHVELRSSFENFCRARPGHVTRTQFARIMAMHGFRLTEEQLSVICRAYCDTSDPQELNYLMFCESLERPRSGVGAGGPASPAGPPLTPAPPAGAPKSRPARPLSNYGYGRAQALAADRPAGQRPR